MSIPKYVARVARLPQVFALLQTHPDGLALRDLAAQFHVTADELSEDLLAFFAADDLSMLGLSRPLVLEFLGADGEEIDPNEAVVVRIIDERPAGELGAEYLDAAELALIWTSAHALAEVEPDNTALHEALEVLAETMFGEVADDRERVPRPSSGPAPWAGPVEDMKRAMDQNRRVRIVYSRAWQAGTVTRVIEPYRLVQTRRGWEVDAGAVEQGNALRTFLLSNIRECEVLTESFVPPANLTESLVAARTTRRVRVRIPHDARWAADMYAERVEQVADDEHTQTLDLDLLPPVERRVGLVLLSAGVDAYVLEPAALVRTGPDLAKELLAHHRPEPQ